MKINIDIVGEKEEVEKFLNKKKISVVSKKETNWEIEGKTIDIYNYLIKYYINDIEEIEYYIPNIKNILLEEYIKNENKNFKHDIEKIKSESKIINLFGKYIVLLKIEDEYIYIENKDNDFIKKIITKDINDIISYIYREKIGKEKEFILKSFSLKKNKLILPMGASGSGKNYLIENIIREEFKSSQVISTTTREPRPKEYDIIYKHLFRITNGEIKKQDLNKKLINELFENDKSIHPNILQNISETTGYKFISINKFDDLIKKKEFVNFTSFKYNFYGTQKKDIITNENKHFPILPNQLESFLESVDLTKIDLNIIYLDIKAEIRLKRMLESRVDKNATKKKQKEQKNKVLEEFNNDNIEEQWEEFKKTDIYKKIKNKIIIIKDENFDKNSLNIIDNEEKDIYSEEALELLKILLNKRRMTKKEKNKYFNQLISFNEYIDMIINIIDIDERIKKIIPMLENDLFKENIDKIKNKYLKYNKNNIEFNIIKNKINYLIKELSSSYSKYLNFNNKITEAIKKKIINLVIKKDFEKISKIIIKYKIDILEILNILECEKDILDVLDTIKGINLEKKEYKVKIS